MSSTSSPDAIHTPTKGRYSFTSLGCPKNLVDSERMLGLLQLDGYELVRDSQEADFAIVNTCGFIEQARAESFAAIEDTLERKRRGELRGVIVSGCLAERQQAALLERYPGIDHLVGVFGREEVTKVADRLIGRLDEQRMVFRPAPTHPLPDRARMRITPRHFAYLKISEGCDRLCTFCAIPKMRGKHATKPLEEVLAEARELAADGVRELVIVAQDTTYYGMDLYGEPRLAELLHELEAVDGLDWIRLMYLYPMYFSDQVIDAIAGSQKIVPYLDMPLQHINDRMLRRMQRRVCRAETERLLDSLRQRIPNLVLRTTLITGFPGESEPEFSELADFIQERRFERLGVFTYSLEPDTPAARLPGHLSEAVKDERRERLMRIQQQIAFEWNERQIGKQCDVLIDAPVPDEPNAWIGRTYADAPDVDGVVYVTGENLTAGALVSCEIVATSDYDLVAVSLADAPYARVVMSVTTEKQPARVFNVPNQLTSLRLLLSIILFVFLGLGNYDVSLWLFIFAASTDWLDGYYARKYGQVTVLGRILDPFADKMIICGTFIFLVAVPESEVKAWMVVVIVGRELLVTALRSFLEERGADFSATMSGKLKMVVQCLAVAFSLLRLSYVGGPSAPPDWLAVSLAPLVWAAVAITVYSGIAYVLAAIRIMRA